MDDNLDVILYYGRLRADARHQGVYFVSFY